MIQEDDDDPVIIDFSWFYFMGKTRFGLSIKETGRMTLNMFYRWYEHYKNTWSYEMRLSQGNMTYAEAEKKIQEAEDWF